MTDSSKYLTRFEAAELLGVTWRHLYRLRLPRRKVDGQVVFTRTAVERLRQQRAKIAELSDKVWLRPTPSDESAA